MSSSGQTGSQSSQQPGDSMDNTASGTGETGTASTAGETGEMGTTGQQSAGEMGQNSGTAGTGNMPQGTTGQSYPGSGQGAGKTNEQILSEAMEVFNSTMQGSGSQGQSPQTGGQPGGQQGQNPGMNGAGTQSAGNGTGTDPYGQQGQMPGTGSYGTQPAGGATPGSGQYGSMPSGQFPGGYGTGDQSGAGTEQGQGGGTFPGATGSEQGSGGYPYGSRRVIVDGEDSGVLTQGEQVQAYDRELEEQMRVFDGIILGRRQETIARSNEEGADVQAPPGGAYGGGSDSTAPPLLTTASNAPAGMSAAGNMPDIPADNREGDFQNEGTPRNDRVPDDISDGSDDDIVARQLREAAMAEDDPVLREKLWDEYRKYKEGVQARQ